MNLLKSKDLFFSPVHWKSSPNSQMSEGTREGIRGRRFSRPHCVTSISAEGGRSQIAKTIQMMTSDLWLCTHQPLSEVDVASGFRGTKGLCYGSRIRLGDQPHTHIHKHNCCLFSSLTLSLVFFLPPPPPPPVLLLFPNKQWSFCGSLTSAGCSIGEVACLRHFMLFRFAEK